LAFANILYQQVFIFSDDEGYFDIYVTTNLSAFSAMARISAGSSSDNRTNLPGQPLKIEEGENGSGRFASRAVL
jgi:hypothetical protein